MLMNKLLRAFDTLLVLKDAYLVAASAAAQVASANKILDLSNPNGGQAPLDPTAGMQAGALTPMVAVVDVSAIETDTNNESYTIIIQASSSPTFASDVINLGQIQLAAAGANLGGATVAGAVGRYLIPLVNWQNGTTRRYLRAYTVVAGTIATGINHTVRLGEMQF